MTSSISERILVAVEALLQGVPQVGARIWREREEPPSRDECPCLILGCDAEISSAGTVPVVDCRLKAFVDICVSGRPLSTLADPIRVEISQRLMASPRTLGGLAWDIVPEGTEWDRAVGEIGIARLRFEVRFRHRRDDPTATI
jgi:hypothetical protein